ncbi:hypothetical protein ACFW04_008661 [Cataglyphis niger]
MQGLKCLVYLDDIVIYGSSLEEHNKRLKKVLQKLRENNLKLQQDKCEFLRKEVIYLGHIISENGISPDPSKLSDKRISDVHKSKGCISFISLAGYYRKFIENFSKITKPLTKRTQKTEKFKWTVEQQNAFEILKEKLMTTPVLRFPDFNQEFTVTTDAFDYAIEAVLSQGKRYVAKREYCQKNKLSRKNKVPLIITNTPTKPFEKCALDIVGPLTIITNGNKYLLTFQDNLTKFRKAIPIPNQEANTINWDEWIPFAMFTYNTTPHTATGYTPFELVYIKRRSIKELPTSLIKPPKSTYNYDDYVQELKERLRATNQFAKEPIKEKKIKAKKQYDKNTREIKFKVGDKVLMYDETLRCRRSKKLESLCIGYNN